MRAFSVFTAYLFAVVVALPLALMSSVAAKTQDRAPADIAAHCLAVGTADQPVGAYDYPPWLQSAMGVVGDSSANTAWRCMSGAVYACVGYDSASCRKPDQSRTPSADMGEYCLQERNASFIPRSGGGLGYTIHTWRCRNGRPQISRVGSNEHLDARGFVREEWRSVEPPAPSGGYDQPVAPRGRVHGFFDQNYRQSENRQHLGVDLPSPAGTSVVSPIDGEVVFNRTQGTAASSAFLIIRDTNTGAEHVLGHIASSLSLETIVRRGEVIGTIKDWGANSHVHWGINTHGVPRAVQSGPGGDWGWGRGPASVTQAQALARGWVEPQPNYASDEDTLARTESTMLGGVDLLQPIRALGNEPFWGVDIQSDRLIFEGVNRPREVASRGATRPANGAITITGRTDRGRDLAVTLIENVCSDGMSDRVYPLTVQVQIGSERLQGCAISSTEIYAETRSTPSPRTASAQDSMRRAWTDVLSSPSLVLEGHPAAELAWQRIIPARYRSTAWIFRLHGNTSEVSIVSLDGKAFALGGVCKPHDCYDNSGAFLIALDNSVSYGAVSFIQDGRTLPPEYFGNPGPVARNMLIRRATQGRD